MVTQLVEDEIARDELVRLMPAGSGSMSARIVLGTAYSGERGLGLAAT